MLEQAKWQSMDEQNRRVVEQQRHAFEQTFNRFIKALGEFTQEYNETKGDVWPTKKAEALMKAFRDVERTGAWRKGDLTKAGTSWPETAVPASSQ
jgi:hypothetical protein